MRRLRRPEDSIVPSHGCKILHGRQLVHIDDADGRLHELNAQRHLVLALAPPHVALAYANAYPVADEDLFVVHCNFQHLIHVVHLQLHARS